MKSYRNAAAALTLTLVLATSAFAGEMHTGVTGPNPQPTPVATTADGEMHTGVAAPAPEAVDTVTATALNLLQSVLALF
jgi:hypothetical protein